VKNNPNTTNNEFIDRIVLQLSDLFFQFTFTKEYSIVINYYNDAIFEFYELTKHDIDTNLSQSLLDKVVKEDFERFFDSIKTSFEYLTRWELEYRVQLPKKGLRWIKVSAKTEKLENGDVIFFGTQTDITEVKNDQENHRISEARNQFANMASNVGVWDWNLVTNKVFYSAESLKILEIDENGESLTDDPEKWDDRVHPEDLEAYFGNIQLHFDQKIPYYETYHRVLCNGKYKWILDRGKVISRDENGKPLRIVGTHTDVSSQKIREQDLKETLELVNEQKNKLLNFAYIVSHNLNSHTGNLRALLNMRVSEIMKLEEIFPLIETVSKDLDDTLEDLFELIEVQGDQNKEKIPLNIDECLSKVFSVLVDDIRKNNIKIENKVPKSVFVDFIPAYLESILLNLTTNAIKYAKSNEDTIIEYTIEYKDNFKILSVKDNGIGINLEKYKEHIFGLYKTFHKNENSRGIGLYITKNQIESMGGKIEVESEVGIGTTFKIFFK
jgi:PAS domain-containing protein